MIDPKAPRYTALQKSEVVPLYIPGAPELETDHPLHPKVPRPQTPFSKLPITTTSREMQGSKLKMKFSRD